MSEDGKDWDQEARASRDVTVRVAHSYCTAPTVLTLQVQ